MEGRLGILVGGRTELALFTAINSLPLTTYRFLLSESFASCSSTFLDFPRRPTRAVFILPSPPLPSSPLLSSPSAGRSYCSAAIRNNLGVFFLRHVPSHKNVVHGRLKPR